MKLWLRVIEEEVITEMTKPLPDGILTAHTVPKLVDISVQKDIPEAQGLHIYL